MHFSMATLGVSSTNRAHHRLHHASRFVLECEMLEDRQLLSAGQPGIGTIPQATAPVSASASDVPPAGASTGVSGPTSLANASSLASEFGSPSGLNYSQVGYLLEETGSTGLPLSLQPAGVSIPQTLNGTTNTVINLSVTALNPDMTSSTAAITDTQVDADAYLVPTAAGQLRDLLGQSTAPAVTHVYSAATLTSDPVVARSPVTSNAPPPVTIGGANLSANSDVNPPSSQALDFVEPSQAQPGAASEQTPSTPTAPQTAPQSEQAPPSAPGAAQAPSSEGAPEQPAGQGTPSSAPAAGSEPAPGQEGSAGGVAQFHAIPPMSAPAVDAALALADTRIPTRLHDGDIAQANDDALSATDTSWSFSAIFGAAAVAAAGYNLALRGSDVSRARFMPRWSGAERPAKGKTA
jgi:hypothetical protein